MQARGRVWAEAPGGHTLPKRPNFPDVTVCWPGSECGQVCGSGPRPVPCRPSFHCVGMWAHPTRFITASSKYQLCSCGPLPWGSELGSHSVRGLLRGPGKLLGLSFSVPTCKMGSMLRVNEWITHVKGWPRGGSFKRHFACFFLGVSVSCGPCS